jgi:hypothetical protein
MKPTHLKIVVPDGRHPPREVSVEKQLKKLLREERALELRLTAVRSKIGPVKRAYLEKHKCFGMSNEALLKTL